MLQQLTRRHRQGVGRVQQLPQHRAVGPLHGDALQLRTPGSRGARPCMSRTCGPTELQRLPCSRNCGKTGPACQVYMQI